MSREYKVGDKVKILGVTGEVRPKAPGNDSQNLVLVKLPDGTERFVTKNYLDTINKPAERKAAPAKKEAAPKPKAKKAPAKKAPAKKKAPKKSAKTKK